MMSPRRVVVVLEAERLLSPKRGKDEDEQPDLGLGTKKKRGSTPVEDLEVYFEKPEPMTTLVFVAGGLDGNRRLVKLLRKHADCVDCGSLASPQEAAAWIRKRLEKDELSIDTKALALLIETTGLSLGRIRAEIEKLVLYASGETIITPNHVRDLVLPQNESGRAVRVDGCDSRRPCRDGAQGDLGVDGCRDSAADDPWTDSRRRDPPAAGDPSEEGARPGV